MCGRQTQLYSWEELHRLLALTSKPQTLCKRYNLAPGQSSSVIVCDPQGGRELHQFRWGLIPAWAKDIKIGYKLINARAETINQKPSFRNAFKARRCLIPVSGFYEWQTFSSSKQKQAYYIHSKESPILMFAGIWEAWLSLEGQSIKSYSIITTHCNETLRPLHERMPVVLNPSELQAWLDPQTREQDLLLMLKPARAELLRYYAVSSIVNSAKNDIPECITPVSV